MADESASKDIIFSIDDLGGTLRDIKVTEIIGLPGGRGLVSVTSLGDDEDQWIPGLEQGEFLIRGICTSTAVAAPPTISGTDTVLGPALLDTGTLSFEFGWEGSATGAIKYSGECLLTDYEIVAKGANPVMFIAKAKVDGSVTRGTYA